MNINYRPEIDGLRALAVISVILYHAELYFFDVKIFKGGYIGVDIFFVISGYLITSIIYKELLNKNSFSYLNFYKRRARRILPALLFVMLVTIPFAWKTMIPSDFIDYAKSILYSLGFTSNFYFWYTGQAYAAESSLIKPFLHTWSLSVEEQYYIFFPIIFLIIFKFFKKYLLSIIFLGFFLSIGLADWLSKNHPGVNFYMLPTRGWELLAGSLLAYYEIKFGRENKSTTLNLVLPTLGFVLVLYSFLFFSEQTRHPSVYTLIPVIGVSLIIWFSSKKDYLTNVLSSRILVGTGLISYSLYLWHYPIFAFARIKGIFYDNLIFIGALTVLLSLISYFLIERPARNKNFRFSYVLTPIICTYLFLSVFNSNIISNYGYKHRIPEILNLEKVKVLRSPKNFKLCHHFNSIQCAFNTSSSKKVFLIGDSHMAQISADLKDELVDRDYQFITSTIAACIYYPGFNIVSVKTNKIDKCNNKYFENLRQILIDQKNAIIIFGGRYPVYLNKTWFDNQEGGVEGKEYEAKFVSVGKYKDIQTSFKSEILELSKKNKIILIYPIPEVGWKISRKLFNSLPKDFDKIQEYLIKENFITTSHDVYKERSKTSFDLLDSVKNQNIYRVYPHKLFCDKLIPDRCLTHDDKNLFYEDDDHVSLQGAKMINKLILKEIKKIENNSN